MVYSLKYLYNVIVVSLQASDYYVPVLATAFGYSTIFIVAFDVFGLPSDTVGVILIVRACRYILVGVVSALRN